MRVHLIIAIAAILVFSNAGAITVSGDVSLLSTPPSAAGPGNLVSRQHAFAWAEQRDVSLSGPLFVDVVPFQNNSAGIYRKNGRARVEYSWYGDIAPGSVDSFIVHADQSGRNVTLAGSITFDADIIGIIFAGETLAATDSLLGALGTTYAGGASERGIELRGRNSWFSISSDLRTFAFQTVVGREMDEFRILTNTSIQSTIVPIPAAAWLFGSALCLLGRIRRR